MILDEIKAKCIVKEMSDIEKIKRSTKPILIYGASSYSKSVYIYLRKNDIEIEAFVVDASYWKENSYIENVKVKCLEDYNIEDYSIVIGFGDVPKSRFLINNQSLLKSKFYFLWDATRLYDWDIEYVKNNWNSLLEVYQGLADEKSRRVLYELIIAKLSHTCTAELIEVADGGHYFNELTCCSDGGGVYLDCGAYTGDTVLEYIAFTNWEYKKIYAFEPDPGNLNQLRKNVGFIENVEIIDKGTWNEKSTLTFVCSADGGCISAEKESNSTEIQVTTIDEIVGHEKVSFIKMDVEGSELESLQGAVNTIRRDMPKLAICSYHKRDDITVLYKYIKELKNPKKEYKIFLRHYSNSSLETILYAIPVKRQRS